MLYKIQMLFFIILFFASTGSSQNEVPKAAYSLIFETEFEDILEGREHVNFQKVSNLNGVADEDQFCSPVCGVDKNCFPFLLFIGIHAHHRCITQHQGFVTLLGDA